MSDTNIEPELNSLKDKLEAAIQADSSELEAVKKRIEKNQALLVAVKGSLGLIRPYIKPTGYGSKAQIIREGIARVTKARFTWEDVAEAIDQIDPEAGVENGRLRGALWEFATKNQGIRLAVAGSTNTRAVYEKIDPSHANGSGTPITADVLVGAVKQKTGRIKDLAKRLNTDDQTVQSLLEPASKVYVAEKGWLKVRQ